MALRSPKQRRLWRRNSRAMAPVMAEAKRVLSALHATSRERWTRYSHGFEPCPPSLQDEVALIAAGLWPFSRKVAISALVNARGCSANAPSSRNDGLSWKESCVN